MHIKYRYFKIPDEYQDTRISCENPYISMQYVMNVIN